MAYQINVILDDRVWGEFQQIPKGKRSGLNQSGPGRGFVEAARQSVRTTPRAGQGKERLASTTEGMGARSPGRPLMSGLIVIDVSVILQWVLPPGTKPHQPEALPYEEVINDGRGGCRSAGSLVFRSRQYFADQDLLDFRDQLCSFEKSMTDVTPNADIGHPPLRHLLRRRLSCSRHLQRRRVQDHR